MRVSQIIISGTSIDLYKDEPINLVYSIADIRGINNRNSTFSKQISVPATITNNVLFSHLFEIGVSSTYLVNKKASCIVAIDTIEVINGYVQLTDIERDLSQNIASYKLIIYGNNFNFFKSLGESKIVDLDWSGFTHNKNLQTIKNSWHRAYDFVYPLIDTGHGWQWPDIANMGGQHPIWYDDLKPAFFIKPIVDKIFSAHGFTYASNFFNSTFFNNLVYFPPAITGRALEADVTINLQIQFNGGNAFTRQNVGSQGTVRVVSQNPSTLQKTTLLAPTFLLSPNAAGATQTADVYSTGRFLLNPGDKIFVEIDTSVWTTGLITNTNFTFGLSVGPMGNTKGLTITYIDSANVQGDIYVGPNSTASNPAISGTQALINQRLPFIWETTPYYDNFNLWNTTTHEYTVQSAVIYNHIPATITQASFMQDLTKCFNLYWDIDKLSSTGDKIIVEPRKDYYALSNTIRDWSELLDISKPINISLLSELQSKRIKLSLQPDGDYLNEKYQKDTNETYGELLLELDNDFLTGTMEIMPQNFASTPMQQIPGTNFMLIPRIYDREDNVNQNIVNPEPASSYKGRLLYYAGLVSSVDTYEIDFGPDGSFGYNTMPWAGEWDNPYASLATISLNFNTPEEVFFSNSTYFKYPQENLYTTYYAEYISGITDSNSKMLTAFFNLGPADLANVSFNDVIFVNDQYYILNKIEYNALGNSTTRCELLLLTEHIRSLKNNKIIRQRLGAEPTVTGKGNTTGPFSSAFGIGNNMHRVRSSFASGNFNTVSAPTEGVFILGNSNTIGGLVGTEHSGATSGATTGFTSTTYANIAVLNGSYNTAYTNNGTFINGSGNTINGYSLHDITIINLNDFTGATSSNTVYMGYTNFVSGFTTATINGLPISAFTASTGSSGGLTLVQPGLNTYTGGTYTHPSVNISAFTGNNISISGTGYIDTLTSSSIQSYGSIISDFDITAQGIFYSGTTNIANLFLGINTPIPKVQPGVNTYTGGTYILPSVNISGGSFHNITTSGLSRHLSLSGTSFSGGSIFSGTTNLTGIFVEKGLNLQNSNRIYSQKSGSTALFRTLSAGTNISLTENPTNIVISNNYTYTPPRQDLTCVVETYNATTEDYLVGCDTLAAAMTIYLPSSPPSKMEIIIFDKSGNAGTNNITIDGNGPNIDGSLTYTMNNNWQSTCLHWIDCSEPGFWKITRDYIPREEA